MDQKWNTIYQHSITPALERLRKVQGVLLGFHSVIDGIKRVRPGEIETILNADLGLKQSVQEKIDAVPIEIFSPADMLAGLLVSIKSGRSYRMVIRNEDTFRWILENFGYDQLKLGGTSGCMANSLAPLDLQKILVYTNPLAQQLLELFSDNNNLHVVTQINGNIQLEHPHQAWQHKGIEAIHWGFEFAQGTTIQLDKITLIAPRASRFYPCWNPVNNKLLLSPLFKKGALRFIDQFSHFIVAGYQLLLPNYPDGTTCIDYILSTLSYLNKLKVAHPPLKLHFECDTIPADEIWCGIRKHVLPQMDSMGLNEVELDYFIKDMRSQKINQLDQENQVKYYLSGLIELANESGLERIHFHNFDYYICLTKGSQKISPKRTRQAMILSAIIAGQEQEA
ncbi:TPA: hypothetical protein EYN09_03735 [Candidatus Poribacteria bacterium]|nr:hypothetical protein [Candidatus Poribacteria bacterium]